MGIFCWIWHVVCHLWKLCLNCSISFDISVTDTFDVLDHLFFAVISCLVLTRRFVLILLGSSYSPFCSSEVSMDNCTDWNNEQYRKNPKYDKVILTSWVIWVLVDVMFVGDVVFGILCIESCTGYLYGRSSVDETMLSMGTYWQLCVTSSIDKRILVCPLWHHRWYHVDKNCQTTHVSHGFSASKSRPILLIDCPKYECKVFVAFRESLESWYVVWSPIIINHLRNVHGHPLDILGRLWVDVCCLLRRCCVSPVV